MYCHWYIRWLSEDFNMVSISVHIDTSFRKDSIFPAHQENERASRRSKYSSHDRFPSISHSTSIVWNIPRYEVIYGIFNRNGFVHENSSTYEHPKTWIRVAMGCIKKGNFIIKKPPLLRWFFKREKTLVSDFSN